MQQYPLLGIKSFFYGWETKLEDNQSIIQRWTDQVEKMQIKKKNKMK